MRDCENATPVILTGDRPTGPLHLGHYVGTLKNRIEMQTSHRQFVLVADAQGLTDNADNPDRIRRNVIEVCLDYLAVGIDPAYTTICLQSAISALSELTVLYLNYVTVARLERNPTIKDEIRARGFGRDIPAGFLCYPVAQAADITAFKATLVPVGDDQVPIIEQTNEIVRRINCQAGCEILLEAKAVVPKIGRLPGVSGEGKMSKSQGSAIYLSASRAEIESAVRQMYTDPGHLRASDPGKVEGNVVFTYLDAFDPDVDAVADLKARYRRGGLGDVALKQRLVDVLETLIAPIRERRAALARHPDDVLDVLRQGTKASKITAQQTLDETREALRLSALV
ncbi:tryptophan--tRNA ligase [Methylocystis sp. MJC1]|jgi:tryptophanyl-tRNA synthetase|uniref:tryptophan--tRNA ligase n=1 Tax=Methylocystis sp. MJC1 TaxID=2654282 RepID=UPI0013EBA9B5|nr:tryptophan--tRNA ligase [Methylocystis sp. MJC1]KAF2991979.1 Tryptophan--tRNA ligase 2 [Methylocystis sp. MJC1]MBU6525468.1 tryptophan--tRNA ligase [Methylocystis sp. MJC1]UZX11957.1 tryptophan--tRNA ligase [Methylocystis sp. MJC1]